MSSVRSVCNRAARWLGILQAGEDLEAEDAADFLEALQGVYLDVVNVGANLINVLVTANYTAGENVRIAYSGATTATITLPTTIEEPSDHPSTDTAVDNDNRAPHDYAVALVSGSTPATWVYDAAIGDWVNIGGLTLTDEAPWSTYFAQGMAAMLAVVMAEPYSRPVPKLCAATAADARLRLTARIQASGDDDGSVFFQPDRRQEWA